MPAAPAVWWHWEHIPDDDEDPEAEDPSPEALLDPGDLGRPDGDDGEAPPPTSLEDMARASEHWRHWIRLFVPSRRRLNEVAFFYSPSLSLLLSVVRVLGWCVCQRLRSSALTSA